jgi:ABC-type multidrug transport system fused ATPase/permease subunit
MLKNTTWVTMLRACWRLADAHERRRMILINALLVVSNAIGLTRPIIIGKVISVVAEGGEDFLPHLEFWLGAMVANMVVYWLAIGPVRHHERQFSIYLRRKLTLSLYDDVTALPWSWHQAHHTGATLNRVNLATSAIYNFADNQFDYFNAFTRLVGSIGLLLFIAPEVGWVIALVVPPLYYVMRRFDLVSIKVVEDMNLASRHLSAGLVDYIGNIASLMALRLTRATRANLLERFGSLDALSRRDMSLGIAKWATFSIAVNVATAGSLLFYLTHQPDLRSAIMAGTVVTVFQYLQQIDGAITGFASNYQGLLRHRVNLKEIDEIEREAEALRSRSVSAPVEMRRTASIRNVSFRYEDEDHHLHQLHDVSLDLERGKRIALVGSSGSGKSTLLRLLRGLHKPALGTAIIDGMPQPDFSSLAECSTLILQDTEIFENTIRYNITCGLDADDAALDEAVRLSCLEPVLDMLPQGLDTDIRERGVNLSGGQKQRLALARGLYAGRNSSLLLLDEPTSSLDPITEADILSRLFAARSDACIVASLHRLHLLDRFDHVYVLAKGRVAEHGTLEQLLASDGVFQDLWQAQSKEDA